MCIGMPLIAGLVMLGLSITCLFLENYEGNYKFGLLFMIQSVTLILVSITGVITKRIIESDKED